MPKLLRTKSHSPATKALVAGGIVAFIVLPIGCATVFFAKGCDMVEETIRAQATSPDGKHTAAILERGGDATVGFFRMVVLCEGGGACTANGENVIASEEDQGISNVGWIGNNKLIVYYSPSFTKFRGRADTYKGVKIEYVPQGK